MKTERPRKSKGECGFQSVRPGSREGPGGSTFWREEAGNGNRVSLQGNESVLELDSECAKRN